MNVFELFATLGLDASQYEEGLANAETQGSNFGKTLGAVVGTGAQIATAAIAATTTATIAGTAAFINGVSNVAEYGDMVDKTSQKLGLSTQAFQEWDYVMNIAGTSMQSMQMGVKTLTNQIDAAINGSADAQEKFAALGITMEDLQTMSREDIFEAAIYGFQGMADSTERAALANDLFGKSGQELTPLFNMTAEETQQLIETANEYGMVMSEDAVKASATFEDSLTTLKGTLSGLKNNMLSEFLPSFSTVMDGLAAVFAGDDSGLAMIDEGVNDFIENLNEVAPKALEIGASILTSLISAISSNLPILLSEGSSILNELIQGIILALPSLLQSAILIIGQIGSALLDNAPLLFSTALDLILMLANSITQNATVIIPSIVTVVQEIVAALTAPDTLTLLISAALQLVLALAEGLVLAIPDLVSIIPMYYANIITVMIDMFPDILNAVLLLIGDLAVAVVGALAGLMGQNYDTVLAGFNGISTLINSTFASIVGWFSSLSTNLTSTVSAMWDSIVGFFTNGLNDALSFVINFGSDMLDGFNTTFDNAVQIVSDAINTIIGLFDFEWSLPDLKLPHFSISGKLDLLAQPPTYPSVSVSWYKKAMDQAYMLNGATIFGAQGGKLLGGGEAGSEMVIGTNTLMSMMREAVGVESKPITINIYGAEGQDVRLLAKEVSKELQNSVEDKKKIFA